MNDEEFAEFIAWLKVNKMEAHTTRGQTLIVKPRRPKRSRLTGKLK